MFDQEILDLLDRSEEIDIETWRPAGDPRRTIIWIVVLDGVPHVRSVRGDRGRWYRDLQVESHGAIHVDGRRIPFRAEPATDQASMDGFERVMRVKYGRGASVVAMLQPDTLPTTLRLIPD